MGDQRPWRPRPRRPAIFRGSGLGAAGPAEPPTHLGTVPLNPKRRGRPPKKRDGATVVPAPAKPVKRRSSSSSASTKASRDGGAACTGPRLATAAGWGATAERGGAGHGVGRDMEAQRRRRGGAERSFVTAARQRRRGASGGCGRARGVRGVEMRARLGGMDWVAGLGDPFVGRGDEYS